MGTLKIKACHSRKPSGVKFMPAESHLASGSGIVPAVTLLHYI